MRRYEGLSDDKKPFSNIAKQPHISDDEEEDDPRVDEQVEPAHPGSSHKVSELDRFGGKHPVDSSAEYGQQQPLDKSEHAPHLHHVAHAAQLLPADRRDEGAHVAPTAQQETQHDHADFDDTVGYNGNRHGHALLRQ